MPNTIGAGPVDGGQVDISSVQANIETAFN